MIFSTKNTWQMTTFQKYPLDALVPKIPFSFLFLPIFGVPGHLRGSVGRILGGRHLSLFLGGGRSSQRAASTPPPPPEVERPPTQARDAWAELHVTTQHQRGGGGPDQRPNPPRHPRPPTPGGDWATLRPFCLHKCSNNLEPPIQMAQKNSWGKSRHQTTKRSFPHDRIP